MKKCVFCGDVAVETEEDGYTCRDCGGYICEKCAVAGMAMFCHSGDTICGSCVDGKGTERQVDPTVTD